MVLILLKQLIEQHSSYVSGSFTYQTNCTERREAVKNKSRRQKRLWWAAGVPLCVLGISLWLMGAVATADDKAQKKVLDQKKAFAIYQQKCLTCHDSVADPEKEGRTRDDWHLVVNVMHGYGMDLTDAEAAAITDLLYELRSGIEKEAG
jgi:mono/diheme cytochrome c family protein